MDGLIGERVLERIVVHAARQLVMLVRLEVDARVASRRRQFDRRLAAVIGRAAVRRGHDDAAAVPVEVPLVSQGATPASEKRTDTTL